MKKRTLTLISLMLMLSLTSCGNVSKSTETSKSETATSTDQTEQTEKTKPTETEKDDTNSSNNLPESKSWPEYKETMTYLLDNNLADSQYVKMLNPDIYGTETAGKATYEFSEGTCTPDIGEYIKTYDLTTTKGYKIWAYWYVETNTVQYVYTGEVSPWGGWMTDETSIDTLINVANSKYGSANFLNLTHQDKIDALGTPAMTDDEVVAAIKTKYGM